MSWRNRRISDTMAGTWS